MAAQGDANAPPRPRRPPRPPRGWRLCGQHASHVAHDAAQRAAADVGGHRDHLLLIFALETHARFGAGEGCQTAERCGARNGQGAQAQGIEPHGIGGAHAHRDRTVLTPDLSRLGPEQRAAHGIPDILRCEPETPRLRLIHPHEQFGRRLAHSVEQVLEPLGAVKPRFQSSRVGFQ